MKHRPQGRTPGRLYVVHGQLKKRLANRPGTVVEQDVDAPELGHGFLEQPLGSGSSANIAHDQQSPAAERFNLQDGFPAFIFEQVADSDAGPFPRHRQRRGLADSSSAAGHHGNFAFQFHAFTSEAKIIPCSPPRFRPAAVRVSRFYESDRRPLRRV